ncbi:dUTP diphosphatase [Candidatus Clostridium stratigraminis]|uniref:dUTP diphosphatase n=1 Tax=Candidatus Clostridium stratigraminis TaxID=3381661 RepID=A0ABW8SYF2_9CLOT
MIKLDELLELQKELDDFIIEQRDIKLQPKELLTDTLLALQVEVSELANTTRCFKHWSNKGPDDKNVILEEYVDALHFLLSIGNQLNFRSKEIEDAYFKKRQININRVKEGY